jgi:hypothetical protein
MSMPATTLDATLLDETSAAQYRDLAIGQIQFARAYTLQLIDGIEHDQWFVRPENCTTHLAWQVGHLAVSQYGLMLFRQRGRAEGDLELMPGWLRKKFGRGTQPVDDASQNPSPAELLTSLATIHAAAMEQVAELPVAGFLEPADLPYAVFPNRLGALLFCPLHESLHAGQIGLWRRSMGMASIR